MSNAKWKSSTPSSTDMVRAKFGIDFSKKNVPIIFHLFFFAEDKDTQVLGRVTVLCCTALLYISCFWLDLGTSVRSRNIR